MMASELVRLLQAGIEKDGDQEVIIQSDAEGNSYESIRGCELGYSDVYMEHVYTGLEEAANDGVEEWNTEAVFVIYP